MILGARGGGGFGQVYRAQLREKDGSTSPVIVKKVSRGLLLFAATYVGYLSCACA